MLPNTPVLPIGVTLHPPQACCRSHKLIYSSIQSFDSCQAGFLVKRRGREAGGVGDNVGATWPVSDGHILLSPGDDSGADTSLAE